MREASSRGRQTHGGEGKWTPALLPRLPSTTTKSTSATASRRKRFHRSKGGALNPGDDHLGNAHSASHPKRLAAEVHQRHHQLTAVVAVDRSRRIGQGDPVAKGQARPRPDLTLVPLRHCYAEPGPEQPPLQRRQITVIRASQVISRRAWGSRTGER
jgi:hypothetical protein